MRTLYPDPDATVPQILADRLLAMASLYMPGTVPGAEYVYTKLLAAEADASRRLRVLFVPTEVVPHGTDPATTAAFDADGIPWVEEPPYDMTPGQYMGDKWGYVITRQRPIIAVHAVSYHYPVPNNLVWTMPADWIRVDKKYGHLQFVPTGTPVTAPLSAYVLGAMAHGRTIPQMIHIRYRAGLEDALTRYPDLDDLIMKMAVMRIMQDWFLPQSGSISADGLSQSFSVDMARYEGQIESRIEALRQYLHGQRMIFL